MTPKERQVFSEAVAACEAVVNNWEHGNLAHAANLCDEAAGFGQEMLDDKQTAVVTAQMNAEPAVGLPALGIYLEFDRCLIEDDEQGVLREHIRRRMRQLVAEIADGSVHAVYFDDECPECEGRLVQGRCPNVNCYSNRPQESV